MRTICCVFLLMMLGACTNLRGVYVRPHVQVPDTGTDRAGMRPSPRTAGGRFLAIRCSPGRIDRAVEVNADLASAAYTVRKARLQATHGHQPYSHGQRERGGSESAGSADREHHLNAGGTVNLAYEVDLWGKLAAARTGASGRPRPPSGPRGHGLEPRG